MKFPCEIDNQKTIKKGMKITLMIDKDNMIQVMQDLHMFIDKPLIVDIKINSEERKKELMSITADQRKKIYAIFRDIADYTGANKDYTKENLKKKFTEETEYEQFSLSNCEKQLASDFIKYLIEFCFEYGVELNEHPKDLMSENLEGYFKICIKRKICSVCGRAGEVHHVDTIGMGRNRNKVDDSQSRKICLCRKHHSEAHNSGWHTFSEKYHVEGVIYD